MELKDTIEMNFKTPYVDINLTPKGATINTGFISKHHMLILIKNPF